MLGDIIFIAIISFLLYLFASIIWPILSGGTGFSPTSSRKTKLAIKLAKVGPQDILYDLGCGTGPVLAEAKKRGASVVGVEIEPLRWLICRLRIRGGSVILGDMYKVPLGDATVVFIFQYPSVNMRLKEKFEKELKPGTRVVSYAWKINGWEPVKVVEDLYLYVV
jgi:SAM-dependent methyltransferase